MRPYSPWLVISPFNFPCALSGGPAGAFSFLTGPGRTLGQELISHPDLAGVTLTGSHEMGMAIHRL